MLSCIPTTVFIWVFIVQWILIGSDRDLAYNCSGIVKFLTMTFSCYQLATVRVYAITSITTLAPKQPSFPHSLEMYCISLPPFTQWFNMAYLLITATALIQSAQHSKAAIK
ncbi:hypothetical protein F5B19DRAFT_199732 [Rostrohypoxylon terebratum]|nr:hypothetical protein F5B19DRAFT_199732 [Rostrohypoxylon terebratum]